MMATQTWCDVKKKQKLKLQAKSLQPHQLMIRVKDREIS